MKVVLSVGGTWHAPHLGYQLQSAGVLQRIFTTTPLSRFQTRAPLQRELLSWLPYPELVGRRMGQLLHVPRTVPVPYDELHAEVFDLLVKRSLPPINFDLFVAFARFGLKSFLYCKERGIPTIVERGSAHVVARQNILAQEYELLGIPRQFAPVPPRLMDRELKEYEVADLIAVPSQFAAQTFVENGISADKVFRIPYGVDVNRFIPRTDYSDSVFRVLCVGNLGPEKGIGHLVTAIEQLDPTRTELVLAGSIDDYTRQLLSKTTVRCRTLGVVPQSQLPDVYRMASAFSLLSVQEGLSMAALEAMAAGLPVVVSERTGVTDLITNGVNGFVVPVRDSQTAAAMLLDLQESLELRERIGRSARRTMLSRSWQHYGADVLAKYRWIQNMRPCPEEFREVPGSRYE